jgi:hypothetical protein
MPKILISWCRKTKLPWFDIYFASDTAFSDTVICLSLLDRQQFVWSLWLCRIFCNYFVNRQNFGKIYLTKFSPQIFWSFFKSKNNSARNCRKFTWVLMWSVWFCQILSKLISGTDFSKNPQYKSHGNPSDESCRVPCGQTDGRTDRSGEANSRFSQLFHEHA